MSCKNLIEQVKDYMHANRITAYQIYTKGKLSKSAVIRFMNGESVTLRTALQIIDYLELDVNICKRTTHECEQCVIEK